MGRAERWFQDRRGTAPIRLLISGLLWLGLSLCSLQLARIDLPDPQTRIDRAVAGRSLSLPSSTDRRARRARPDAAIAIRRLISALAAEAHVFAAPWVIANGPIASSILLSAPASGFAARAPPALG